jgi:hypothetical protein
MQASLCQFRKICGIHIKLWTESMVITKRYLYDSIFVNIGYNDHIFFANLGYKWRLISMKK